MHSRFLLFVPSKRVDESFLFFWRSCHTASLKLTARLSLKINGWKMKFYGMAGMADVQGLLDLLVSGCLSKEF